MECSVPRLRYALRRMRPTRFVALFVVAAAISSAPAPGIAADATAHVAAARTSRATTEHYHLVTSGPQEECDEWARMLEAAWPQYAAFFGAAPALAKDERLEVRFVETK